jgi:hypothetical protein
MLNVQNPTFIAVFRGFVNKKPLFINNTEFFFHLNLLKMRNNLYL